MDGKEASGGEGKATVSQRAEAVAARLRKLTNQSPEIAIVCGSGLSHLGELVQDKVTVKYADIGDWPKNTSVKGHKAELVFGTLGGKSVVCMRGRFHTYEGYNVRKTAFPIFVFKKLGVKVLLVTNAAGGLNSSFNVGDFMVIRDHLNLPGIAGKHPLVGHNEPDLGPRFPAMSDCYNGGLRALARRVATDQGITSQVHEGTYVFVSGPSYETAAESMFLHLAGADAVGMSTVPETLVAHYCGLRVMGVSLITNKSVIDAADSKVATHAEVLAATQGENQKRMQRFICGIIEGIGAPSQEADGAAAGGTPGPKSVRARIRSLERSVKTLSWTAFGLLAINAGLAYFLTKGCRKK